MKEIVEVHTKSGTILEVAETHPLLTSTPNLGTEWKTVAELKRKETLLFHGRQPTSANGDWDRFYFYGVWIGDGHASVQLRKSHSRGIRRRKSQHIGTFRITSIGITAGLQCGEICPEYLAYTQRLFREKMGHATWEKRGEALRLQKGNRMVADEFLKEGMLQETSPYQKRTPRAVWTATPYEIAGYVSGWIDTDGHCTRNQIEITTKEKKIATDNKTLLATLGVRSHLSKKVVKGKPYWRIAIRGKRNIERLIRAGVAPVTTYKRVAMLQPQDARRNDKVSFPIEHLGRLQNEITGAIQTAYGPQSRDIYKKYLKLGNAKRKTVGVNTLHRIFEVFPRALPLLPQIERIIKQELEPEEVKKIVYTGVEEEMFDIEVGQNHTYPIEGVICHNSTSLYAAMLSIFERDNRRSFATIEDPVEYRLPFRATQAPVNEEKGATYPRLIRQAMRNDGDTFLIGEIRDGPTASAAVQLALTGHQVLSSIHANSATETTLRLLELGVDPHLLSETLRMVVAQRLVPTPCPTCRREVGQEEVKGLLRRHGGEIRLETCGPRWEKRYRKNARWVEAEGCPQCGFTGLSGMIAAQEFLVIDAKNRKALKEGDLAGLSASMEERSLPTMEETVWRLAWLGKITIGQAGELTDQIKNY
jgi:hypothetical protein